MISVESADSVLKNYYLDFVKEQIDLTTNPFLAEIEKHSVDMAGNGVSKVVRLGVNGGIGAGTEDGDLPKTDDGNYLRLTQDLKNLFGNIRISDKAIKASRNNEGAFADLLDEEMNYLLRSAKFNLDRMLFGTGSGRLADVLSVSSGRLQVIDPTNLYEGMCVDFFTPTGEFLFGGRKVVFVDKTNNYFKVDGEPIEDNGLPGNAFVTLQNSYNKEISGLGAIFSSSESIYGVPRSSSSALTPTIKRNFGALTEAKLMSVLDELEEKSGNKTNFILCSIDVRRTLMSLLGQTRRFVDTLELKGGWKAVSFNGIPVVADRFCPKNTMYLLNTDDFCLYQLGDWDWITGEDGKILKQVAGKPIYEATLAKYLNLMCFNPSAQAMISGITVTP